MQTIDEQFLEESQEPVAIEYSHPLRRVLAFILDELLLWPIYGLLASYVYSYSLSVFLFALINISVAVYRPYMEYSYGYTLGKKLFRLKVLGSDLKALSLQQAVLRNGLTLLSCVSSSAIQVYFLLSSSAVWTNAPNWETYYAYTFIVLIVIDGMVLFMDLKQMSLHDIIAKTLVVRG